MSETSDSGSEWHSRNPSVFPPPLPKLLQVAVLNRNETCGSVEARILKSDVFCASSP